MFGNIDENHSRLSDKIPLISCPIKTGRGVMSLLTLIAAVKLGCQQVASISQILFVVSEAVRVTVAVPGTCCTLGPPNLNIVLLFSKKKLSLYTTN